MPHKQQQSQLPTHLIVLYSLCDGHQGGVHPHDQQCNRQEVHLVHLHRGASCKVCNPSIETGASFSTLFTEYDGVMELR